MGKEVVKRGRMETERRKKLQAHFLQFMLDKEIYDFNEAAKAISKGDRKKAQMWRKRWRRWMQNDPDFEQMVAHMSMAVLRGGIPGAIVALNRRASKGNVPAIKLAMEAAGFYSPRSQVEHVGEIQISLKGLTRPPSVDDGDGNGIIDADVVED